MKAVGAHIHVGKLMVSNELCGALRFQKTRLLTGAPRTLRLNSSAPVFLFTDGAVEDSSTIGAVLYSERGAMEAVFGEVVPPEVCAHLLENKTLGIIAEMELLPVLVAFQVWSSRLKDKRVTVYLDNDGARHSLISGKTGSETCARLVNQILVLESNLGLQPWFARVPSKSNPADAPSRMEFKGIEHLRERISWDFLFA